MKKILIPLVIFAFILTACSPAPANNTANQEALPTEPPATEPPPPTEEPEPTVPPPPTETEVPSPTPIPGVEVVPVSSMASGMPWLETDEDRIPMSIYFNFNLSKAPWDDVLVRKAFAAATDREAIAEFVGDYYFREAEPATSITPSMILGRDLFNQVGIPFDPEQAKAYLAEAGYPDGADFPTVHILVYQRGDASPSTYFRIGTDVVIPMWEEILGVTVEVEAFPERLMQYPAKVEDSQPDVFIMAWGADYMDPDNFLHELFFSGQPWNLSGYHNPDYDQLVGQAQGLSDPMERLLLYIQAEYLLTEQDVAVIPLFHSLIYIAP